MTRSLKIKISLAIVAVIAAILYVIFNPEILNTIWAFIFLGFPLLVGWANCKSPADRSRDTIDWEMEQERRKKEEADAAIRQRHNNRN